MKPKLHVVRPLPRTFEKRVKFEPRKREHQLAYARYLKYNAWGENGCRFELEGEWNDIPTMIRDKMLTYYMETLMEQV